MVVARGNHRLVAETFRFAPASPFGSLNSVIVAAPSVPDPQRYRPVAFPLTEMVEAVAAARKLFNQDDFRTLIGLVSRGVPHCLLLRAIPDSRPWLADDAAPGDDANSVEVKSYRENLREQGDKTRGADLKRRSRCPRYRECSLGHQCPGIYPFYLELFGGEEFEPLS